MEIVAGFLLVVGLVAVIYFIRFVVNRAVNKGAEVISNAVTNKKNEKSAGVSKKLSDRYRN